MAHRHTWQDGQIVDVFRILEYIGQGYAGEVYRAELLKSCYQLRKGDTVALKLYKLSVLEEENQRSRIARESKFGRSTDHSNLLRIHGLRYWRTSESTRPYLVMEYLEGKTLATLMKRSRIQPGTASRFAIQIFAGLQKMHEAGHWHRDIKPDNIFVTREGVLKIMDFGVIKPIHVLSITPSAKFLGTIRYSAPEYLFRGEYDHRADLYSAGLVLYEMLLRKPLISGKLRFSEQVTQVRSKKPDLSYPRRRRSTEVRILLDMIGKLLQRDPGDRPASASWVINILDEQERSKWWRSRFRFLYSRGIAPLTNMVLGRARVNEGTSYLAFRKALLTQHPDDRGMWLVKIRGRRLMIPPKRLGPMPDEIDSMPELNWEGKIPTFPLEPKGAWKMKCMALRKMAWKAQTSAQIEQMEDFLGYLLWLYPTRPAHESVLITLVDLYLPDDIKHWLCCAYNLAPRDSLEVPPDWLAEIPEEFRDEFKGIFDFKAQYQEERSVSLRSSMLVRVYELCNLRRPISSRLHIRVPFGLNTFMLMLKELFLSEQSDKLRQQLAEVAACTWRTFAAWDL